MDNRSMFYGATPDIFLKARLLRANETKAEKALWKKLSNNQLNGLRFKRQHPIDKYIADFYCHKYKLVIEIDEAYHNNQKQHENDEIRDNVMIELGLHVIRFSDNEVFNNIDNVIDKITSYLNSKDQL